MYCKLLLFVVYHLVIYILINSLISGPRSVKYCRRAFAGRMVDCVSPHILMPHVQKWWVLL